MNAKYNFKVGDKVKHRFRPYYQKSVVTEIESSCNGLVKIKSEDGFYGGTEETWFAPQDLTKR